MIFLQPERAVDPPSNRRRLTALPPPATGPMTVLVTNAISWVGSRFVLRLLQQFRSVRVLVRDAIRAEPLTRLGAEVVVGDLDRLRHPTETT